MTSRRTVGTITILSGTAIGDVVYGTFGDDDINVNPGEEVTRRADHQGDHRRRRLRLRRVQLLPRRPDLRRHGDDPEDDHQALRRGQGRLGQARHQRNDG